MVGSAFHELVSLHDPYFLAWLDLFEVSFPPNEKVLVSEHLNILNLKEQGLAQDHILLAALDEDGKVAGMARYQLFQNHQAAILWYLATHPRLRSQGVGSTFYQEILRRLAPLQLAALILEVEIPQDQPDPEHRVLAARRINFYVRQGARRLDGIHYLQDVGEHQPRTPMHLLVHPLRPLDPQAAFEIIHQLVGNLITITGPLVFDPPESS